MSLSGWRRWLSRPFNPGPRDRGRRKRSPYRPRAEALEDRTLLSFAPAVTYAVGTAPLAVVSGDFNGDGKLDLAVANNGSNTVSVLLGNGDGTFRSSSSFFFVGPGPFALAAADLNGDGHLDLVTVNENNNTLSVLLGKGDGTFQAPATYATGVQPVSVAVGDFNGDGKPDLAVANNGSSTVSIFLGNGDGTFRAAQAVAAGVAPSGVRVGDFNRDGKADLAVTDIAGNALDLLLGNGNGTFAAPRTFATGAAPASLAVGDFNGDGKHDVAVGNYTGSSVSVLLGNGDGTFAPQVAFATGAFPFELAVGDFNGDGKPDLAVTTDRTNGNVAVLLGNGNGTFQPQVTMPAGAAPTGVVVGDFNRDGADDLAVTNSGAATISVFLNQPPKAPPVCFGSAATSPAGAAAAPVTADFNGDGFPDLAVANSDNNTVEILIGNGDGSFQAPQTLAAGNGPRGLAVGDFNGDGESDLAVADATGGTVTILLGNGNGTFQAPQTFLVGASPSSIVVGDFNHDGKADLAVTNAAGNTVSILLGNGNGTFQAQQTFAVGTDPTGIAVGDFNGDGKLDLAVADTGSGAVSLLFGNGNGTFQAQQTLAAGTLPTGVLAADLNGDGQLDLAVASGGGVRVYLGNGDGTFQSAQTFGGGDGVSTLIAGDFNHDGKLDLAGASASEDVVVYRGNGDGTFQPGQIFPGSQSASGIVSGDFNHDGYADLAVTNDQQHNVAVLLNTSPMPHAPGRVAKLFIAGDPTVRQGLQTIVTVLPLDDCGNVVGTYGGTVSLTSSDPAGILPGSYTFTAADTRGHSFNLMLTTVGPQTLTVSDTANSAITGTYRFQVTAPTTDYLQVTAPAAAPLGVPFGLTVAVLDASGKPVKNYTGTVSFTATDTAAGVVLPAAYTFTAADQGSHTFTGVVLQTAGVDFISAGDTTSVAVAGSAGVIVAPLAPHFGVSVPANVVAGLPFSVTVTALDQANDPDAGYVGTVHFTSSDAAGGVVLPADYTFTAADQGTHTFTNGVLLQSTGAQTVTATDTQNSSAVGTAGVTVGPAVTIHLGLSAPAAAVAGAPFSVTVTALDPSNTKVAAYTGTVHFTSSDAAAGVVLPADYTFTAADQGAHTFTGLVLGTAGVQTVSVSDTFTPSVVVTAGVSVTPGPVVGLQLLAPGAAAVGVPFGVTVRAVDRFNNATGNYTGTVHLSLSDTCPGATPPADFTFTAADGGTRTLPGLTFATPGSQFVTVLDDNNPSFVSTAAVAVSPTTAPPGAGIIATGADAGGGPNVIVFDARTHQVKFDFFAYDPRFTGGVRVAVGDVNGDGVPDIITAPGPGGGPDIHVYDGRTGRLIRQFFAYGPKFTGGVYVAAGDVNGDGYADLICGAGRGGGPNITVYSGKDGSILYNFMAFDPRFGGGVRVAAGDVNGDGKADVIAGAGPGGGPAVAVFDGATGALLRNFFAYSPGFTGGVYVAAGDVNGDGKADIITGPGAGGGPNVAVFSGADFSLLHTLLPFDPAFAGGVRVAAVDDSGGGPARIVAVTGPGGGPEVLSLGGITPVAVDQFFAYDPRFRGGLYVAGN